MNSQGTIVVTGGAGLIGSAVIWGLNNRKLEDIWLVDEWEDHSPKARNIKHLAFNKAIGVNKFREMIRNNKEDCSEIKTIFHLGAC